jgi:threonine dehydrogenase-like Zn-dependent dehydrogenase
VPAPSTADLPVRDAGRVHGPFDLVFEASGASALVFEGMQALGKNGVLVLASVTGGHRTLEVPADQINLEFVLGNKVMFGTVNANREYFEAGVRDLALAEAAYPGWAARLLTHPIPGLTAYRQMIDTLTGAKGAIKVFVEIAPLDGDAA